MMADTPYTREYYYDGGINNTLPAEMIEDREIADARNVHPKLTGTGNLIKRCGIEAVSNGAAYTGVDTWVSRPSLYCGKNGNYYSECFVAGATGTFNIYTVANGTVRFTDTTGAVLQGPSWTSFINFDIYADGTRAVKTNNGTSFSAVSNFPTGGHSVIAYNNYLFCIVGNTLRWSDEEDAETWDATHELLFILADKNDSLAATAILGDYLVVFSLKKMFLVQGFGPLDFTRVKKNITCGCPQSLLAVHTPYGLFWWSPMYGLCMTRDGTTIDFPMLRKLAYTFTNNDYLTFLYGSLIWRPQNQCISMYVVGDTPPGETNSALRIDYYPFRDAFYIHNGTASTVIAAAIDDGLSSTAFAGSSVYLLYRDLFSKLYCRKENETLSQDLGVSYTSYILTKKRTDPLKSGWKHTKDILATTNFASAGNMTLSIYADNGAAATQTFTLAQSIGVNDNFVTVNQKHRKVQFYLADTLNQRTEYYGLIENGTLDKVL